MVPLLLCLLALLTSQSLTQAAEAFDEGFGLREVKRVPRNSDLANQVSPQLIQSRSLFSLQGNHKESDDLSFDLMPQAQSYFIEPELPTTTSVRPMFKRRKTLRPISTAEAQRKKKELAEAAEAAEASASGNDNPEELPARKPFKPIRQIHTTGFSKQRPSGSQIAQRPRTRAQMENTNQKNNENANNNYELNEIPTTTEGQYEPTPSKEVDNFNIKSGRSFMSGRRKKISPVASAPQIKIDRPNRFQTRRNLKTFSSTTVTTPSENPVTEASQTSPQESTQSTRNLRNGRPGFVLRPKPHGAESSPSVEDRPLRRRKKPTTEASADDQSVQNTSENGQVSEAPTGRKIPSDNTAFQRNNGFQRRPNLRSRQTRPSESEVSLTPEGSDHSQISADNSPVSMNMRRRPGNARAVALTDSVHESSDSVAVVAVSTPEEAPQNPESETPADSYRPRNLSHRPNPLDKLTNRQASARRFLTPKKTGVTTVAPVVVISSKPGRRSPLSLQNLRNRRLGKPDVTTTEVTPVEIPVSVDASNSTSQNGTDLAKDNHAQPEFDSEEPIESPAAENGTVAGESPETPKVEEVQIPKRPLLPGQRKPLTGRIPLLSKPKVVTTTQKPAHEETTPTPTCEDGKRYNKVLRKCIPPFALRSG